VIRELQKSRGIDVKMVKSMFQAIHDPFATCMYNLDKALGHPIYDANWLPTYWVKEYDPNGEAMLVEYRLGVVVFAKYV